MTTTEMDQSLDLKNLGYSNRTPLRQIANSIGGGDLARKWKPSVTNKKLVRAVHTISIRASRPAWSLRCLGWSQLRVIKIKYGSVARFCRSQVFIYGDCVLQARASWGTRYSCGSGCLRTVVRYSWQGYWHRAGYLAHTYPEDDPILTQKYHKIKGDDNRLMVLL